MRHRHAISDDDWARIKDLLPGHPGQHGKVAEDKISQAVRKVFQLTPRGIIDSLKLRRPIYQKTAAFGHFGLDDPDFTWEREDKVEELQAAAGAKPEAVASAR